jgi:diaminobutyrate-2-oxoglutarate transaminase
MPQPDFTPVDPLLASQSRRESSARSYPRRLPVALVSAQGCFVTDSNGRQYLDCLAGAGSLALGHNHPVVVQAVRDAIDHQYPWTTLDLTTTLKESFVDTLFSTLPDELSSGRIQFCGPSGADAVEAAIKLAKTTTGRTGVAAFGGAYHGMTQGTLSVSGGTGAKEPLGPLLSNSFHLPFPTGYRSVFGRPHDQEDILCASMVRWMLGDTHSGVATPAALLAEPVQGEGGVHPMSTGFAQELRRLSSEASVPLVFDEVQTGMGRTGSVWAFEQLGVIPDMLVLSKAIGGGLPLAVVVYREEFDSWGPGAHAGTFRGNQLAMAAGAATIQYVVENDLSSHADRVGERLRDGLWAHIGADERVGDVRGRGLMVGVELVDPNRDDCWSSAPPADGALARQVQAGMLERGVMLEVGGRDDAVVRMLPPLIISEAEVDMVVEVFADVLAGIPPA